METQSGNLKWLKSEYLRFVKVGAYTCSKYKVIDKGVLVVGVVVLVFYCPSTYFRSFRARSVSLSALFLGKPPRQFTST